MAFKIAGLNSLCGVQASALHEIVTDEFWIRRIGLVQEIAEPVQELIPIRIPQEYSAAFDPPDHNVVQCTRNIKARLAWHG